MELGAKEIFCFKFLSNNFDPLELNNSLHFERQLIIACYIFIHTYSVRVKNMSSEEFK